MLITEGNTGHHSQGLDESHLRRVSFSPLIVKDVDGGLEVPALQISVFMSAMNQQQKQ